MLVPKLLLTPIKIRIFGPKMAKFGPKYAFLDILGQILAFFTHFIPCLSKKKMRTRCLGRSSVMWVTKHLISPVKIRFFFAQRDQIWPKLVFFDHFGPGLAGSFGAPWVGWLVVVTCGLYLTRHFICTIHFTQKTKHPIKKES